MEEGELVIDNVDSGKSLQDQGTQNRFFCLPCQDHFSKHEDYAKHICR